MENILLDERGKSLVGTPWGHSIKWGHPVNGNTLSMHSYLMSGPTGHLKLTDFGLSRYLQWGERAHTICGTLQYMGKGSCAGGVMLGGGTDP